MNNATAKLNLLLVNGDQDMEGDARKKKKMSLMTPLKEKWIASWTHPMSSNAVVIYPICLSKLILIPTMRKAKTSQRKTTMPT